MSSTAVPSPTRLAGLPRWAAPAGVAVLFVAAYLVFRGTGTLPHDKEAPQFLAVTELREWIDDHRNDNPLFLYFLNYIRLFVGSLYTLFETVLYALGWPGITGVMGALAWLAGGWRVALLAVAGVSAFGVLGLWESSVDTLALVAVAVLLSLAIGIPIGVWAGLNARVRKAVTPVLDVIQIMPTFAYLAPLALFFHIGAPAGAIATMIYSIPPAIRITALAVSGVSPTAVEASASLGATRRQTLFKVYLPLARPTMALAINQTIMMALSMVVIANLISAPGLGGDIIRGLSRAQVGIMLPAGIAVVVMAVVLDRMMMAVARRDPHARIGRARLVGAGVLAAAGLALIPVLPKLWPESLTLNLVAEVNDAVRWAEDNWFAVTTWIKDTTSHLLLNPLESLLTSAPWWLVALAVLTVAWRVSGVRPALTALGCLLAIALLGVWEHTMQTMTTVAVAVLATLVIGLLLGVAAARSPRYSAVQRPLLDAAQTMPAFVYLLPALALFETTRFTAIFASVIYAVPPVVRLVEDGIKAVPAPVVEAALSAGSTPGQLLWKVQLPMARRAILLAANQGIVMTLAMVVVGGLVGAGALGYDVVTGFSQRTDFGMGFVAGVATVLLGVMLDRITQGADRRPSPRKRKLT
ncbi:ABC transporter permease [Nonomuraea gerenzanensis]|uniref:L-proline glycine betaine ABC transport system permease protein ProW (TC 3.A.1.12.1) n=1 Tax=Nonomuraea gerenzanensis TaxID=93944 RepID=A0A1M4E2K1_9ACTN|nr:ABC transporter permease subunit [Nonomuraea gerenzanensis]UBU15265.1 ABC transporter permease subunit [Nonomuraea gerenzanensis]SBO93010.1 L-proline glycine betaine ABC transport system permease protein ProW (TC 3.A.1.12.1) [Nonomuraea gerenzanensis]